MKKAISLSVLFLMIFSQTTFAASAPGRKVVSNAGTAVALSTTQTFSQCDICAETDNTGVIVVGYTTAPVAALATRTGIPLMAGDCYSLTTTLENRKNLKDIYIDSTVSGDGVTYNYSY